MFGVRSLTASRRSSRMSNPESHVTILRPTEVNSAPSNALSLFGGMGMEDSDHWTSRLRFISRTMNFCLGPGNIWRFPRQAFSFGSAFYIYLYIVYVMVLGTSVFVFELGQGQYFTKKFAKVYQLCPVMEGIAWSMVFYCIIASILYSMVGVYSFMYIFSVLYGRMKHSYCTTLKKQLGCRENGTNQTQSPESFHFYHYIIVAEDLQSNSFLNWRNVAILILLFFVIGLIIAIAAMKRRWVCTTSCAILVLTLVYSAFASLTVEGSSKGVKKMFVPKYLSMASLTTWVNSIEQSIVSMGVGSGPLITFWPASKLRLLSYRDCILIHSFLFFCTMFSGLIFFTSAGISAQRKNSAIDDYHKQPYDSLHTHIVVTEALNSMKTGLSNLSVAAFYLMLFLSCLSAVVEYLQIIVLFINSFEKIRKFKKTKTVIFVCVFFVIVTGISTAEFGHHLIMSMDEMFIGTSALFIIACEMMTMAYLFGVKNLCDDIEFVLGFIPNFYYQITWLFLPSLLLLLFLISVYLKIKAAKSVHDAVMIVIMVVTIVMPVLVTAGCKIFKAVKTKDYDKLFHPTLEAPSSLETVDEGRSLRSSFRRP